MHTAAKHTRRTFHATYWALTSREARFTSLSKPAYCLLFLGSSRYVCSTHTQTFTSAQTYSHTETNAQTPCVALRPCVWHLDRGSSVYLRCKAKVRHGKYGMVKKKPASHLHRLHCHFPWCSFVVWDRGLTQPYELILFSFCSCPHQGPELVCRAAGQGILRHVRHRQK